jgi:hypothetical protein
VAVLGRRRIAGGFVLAITVLAMMLIPGLAAGNPVPFGDIDLASATDIMLFLSLNFVSNLFLFSAMFLVLGFVWRQNIGRLDPDRNQFILKMLAAVFIITLVGSLIDLATLYVSYPAYKNQLNLKFDALRWGVGLAMILLSILLAALWLLKIRRRVSVLIGLGMAAANLAFWYTQIEHHRDPGVLPLVFLFFAPLLLILVRWWHLKVFSVRAATRPEPVLEGPEPAIGEPEAGPGPDGGPDDIEKAVDSLES